ncbi:PGLS family protein [Megaselia abdita]
MNCDIITCRNEKEVISSLSKTIESLAKEAIDTRGVFRVGFSGGSLVKYLNTGLPTIVTEWSNWRIFFCDERFVPVESTDSTFGTYKRDLLPFVNGLSEDQFVKINSTLNLEECAKDYERRVVEEFQGQSPRFDLLLLGMGPDGHTCSLFPGHKLLKENVKLIAPIDDSPKPPPKRVTMTLPLIRNSKCNIYAMSGEAKKDMAERVFVKGEDLPAGMVGPTNGVFKCFVDFQIK